MSCIGKKLDGAIFKIDFKKAYDKVKWPLLQQVLRMKGFDPVWCDRIKYYVQGGSVGLGSMMILVIYSKVEKN
jgi:hypothetical protein